MKIINISKNEGAFWSHLAFKKHAKKFFQDDGQNESLVCLGAKIGPVPAGLALVCHKNSDEKGIWQLESFFVTEKYRKLGVGTALMTKLKETLADKGCEKLIFHGIASREKIEPIKAFFTTNGFTDFRILSNVYKLSVKNMKQNSRFLQRAQKSGEKCAGKGVKILLKNEISDNLLEKLARQEGIDYPQELSPFKNEDNLDEAFHFFALSPADDIIGWGTTFEQTSKKVIVYRSFFVRKDYRSFGVGYKIFNRCFNHHIKNYPNWDFIFAVADNNPRTDKLLRLYTGGNYLWEKCEFELCLNILNL